MCTCMAQNLVQIHADKHVSQTLMYTESNMQIHAT